MACEEYDDAGQSGAEGTPGSEAEGRLIRLARQVASGFTWEPVQYGVRLLPMELRRATALVLQAAEKAVGSGGAGVVSR